MFAWEKNLREKLSWLAMLLLFEKKNLLEQKYDWEQDYLSFIFTWAKNLLLERKWEVRFASMYHYHLSENLLSQPKHQ